MAILDEEIMYVVVHGTTTGALVVVPFKINACILFAFPIFSDVMILSED